MESGRYDDSDDCNERRHVSQKESEVEKRG